MFALELFEAVQHDLRLLLVLQQRHGQANRQQDFGGVGQGHAVQRLGEGGIHERPPFRRGQRRVVHRSFERAFGRRALADGVLHTVGHGDDSGAPPGRFHTQRGHARLSRDGDRRLDRPDAAGDAYAGVAEAGVEADGGNAAQLQHVGALDLVIVGAFDLVAMFFLLLLFLLELG